MQPSPPRPDRPVTRERTPARPASPKRSERESAHLGPEAARISTLQRTAGNQAVNAMLAGAGAAPPVQRQGAATDAPAPGATVALGGLTLTTYSALLSAERVFSSQLTEDAGQLPADEPARKAAEELVAQARSTESFLQGKGDAPLDQTAADQAGLWYRDFVTARKNVDAAGKAAARADLARTDKELEEAQDRLEQMPEDMADLQRAAFLKKDDALLEKVQHCVGNALLAASAVLDARTKANFMLTKLTAEESHLTELIEHYEPLIEAAHKVMASWEILKGSLEFLHPEGATQLDEETSRANAALDVAVAGTSLIPGMGLYSAYAAILVGVAQKCFEFVTNLVREQAHVLNQLALEQGKLDEVDWSAEPGGREAYTFMVKVMQAGSPDDIPSEIPESLDTLMVDRDESMEKGTGEELPTKGFWFWKHTNKGKMRLWLFHNRQSVWGMLYGSVPAR